MRKIEDREEAKRRQKESNRIAVAKYQEKFKRINCRMDPGLYDQIAATGQSVNTFIIEACEEKLKKNGLLTCGRSARRWGQEIANKEKRRKGRKSVTCFMF